MQDLPHLERAMVIMRSLLRTEWTEIALAVNLSPKQVHDAWVGGMVQLQMQLQNNCAKEHSR